MKTKPYALNLEQKRDLKEAFDILDSDGKGLIDVRDLKVAFRALGYEPKMDEIKSIVSNLNQRAYEAGSLPSVQNGNFNVSFFRNLKGT